jgi:hypothetical protein
LSGGGLPAQTLFRSSSFSSKTCPIKHPLHQLWRGFWGQSTQAIEATIKATAAQSCQCKTSSSQTAPLNTPSTGISITLKVDATGGKLRAR